MPRIAYVNGRYNNHINACVHIEDRGFQFADGVYEVIHVYNKRFIDLDLHLDRLDRSLRELSIPWPSTRGALNIIIREIIRRNRVKNGSIYIQITRGSNDREFAYPANLLPSLIVYARKAVKDSITRAIKGYKAISKPDIRWKRCDIKTVSLLPAVMAKQAAVEKGAVEAWLVDDQGMVTEGTSSNVWIINFDNELITRPANNSILSGVTRKTVLLISRKMGLTIKERAFSLIEAKQSREAFCTSSTALVKPIIQIDVDKIGDGKVGPLTKALIKNYFNYIDNFI
jgi:D-alanine transaminase